jgi:hypothetical protein
VDSLYALYQRGQLPLARLPTGRGERYQLDFALAKQLHQPGPKAVDYITNKVSRKKTSVAMRPYY